MRRLQLFLFLFLFQQAEAQRQNLTFVYGAIVRGDSAKREIVLVFTADEFGEGLLQIRKTLGKQKVKASFFFTGRFYRNPSFQPQIKALQKEGHYLGPHSDQHLLYCDWDHRDRLLVSRDSFAKDLEQNMAAIAANGLPVQKPHLFIPPYEWWNDSIAAWSKAQGLTSFNFTPGMRTNADYTWPALGTTYKSSDWIMNWLTETLSAEPQKFQGAIILIHAGTDPRRKDKLYQRLGEIISTFKKRGFRLKRIDDLLRANEKDPASTARSFQSRSVHKITTPVSH